MAFPNLSGILPDFNLDVDENASHEDAVDAVRFAMNALQKRGARLAKSRDQMWKEAGEEAAKLAEEKGLPFLVNGFGLDDVANGSPCFVRWEKAGRSRPAVVVNVVRFPNGFVSTVTVEAEPEVSILPRVVKTDKDGTPIAESAGRQLFVFNLSRSGDMAAARCVVRIGAAEHVDRERDEGVPLPASIVVVVPVLFVGMPVPGYSLEGIVRANIPEPGRLRLRRRVELDGRGGTADLGIRLFRAGDKRCRESDTSVSGGSVMVEETWTICRHLTDEDVDGLTAIPVVVDEWAPRAFIRDALWLDDLTVVTGGDAFVDAALSHVLNTRLNR